MRLSPELSDSSVPPVYRRKHRRWIPPSPSLNTSTPEDPEDQYSGEPNDESDIASYSGKPDADSDVASYSPSPSSSSQASAICPAVPPTYVNVAPLPIFRGEPGECPAAHLARFDRVCRANNATTVDTVVRIFPVTLDGDAALWYDLAVEPHPSMPWEEIRSAFLRAYRRPDFADRARSELMTIRQWDGEGVNAYHLRLQRILKRWPDHGIPDGLLKGIFIDGLKEEHQDWIVPQRPATLAEAVELALNWEQAESARETRRRNEVGNRGGGAGEGRCGFCDGAHEENVCDVRRRLKELWLRNKEGGWGGVGGGGGGKVVGMLSPSGSLARRGGEGEEGGTGRVVSLRRSQSQSQCQCWKHQCWKKYEKSNSGVNDGNPGAPE
ncbi:hypothetical protein COCNU_02G002580 [Cocos nucifera]|uniref:Retrotransposon gag domain-containing protein n=1 Tax=Cocos nucifera TaxID=13894 RepID=A0A8K0MW00_COCNU|nr:hypothetical protein COCNU_02G002580 [Cocos nucifera]